MFTRHNMDSPAYEPPLDCAAPPDTTDSHSGVLMTFSDQMESYQSRCRQQLTRLQILARSQDDADLSRNVAAEIRDATNAVIREAEAMSHAALRLGGCAEPQAETFLWVRITRLATAADHAVAAARSMDVPRLRAHLRHFDALTSAIWVVEYAVYGQRPSRAAERNGTLCPTPASRRKASSASFPSPMR
jgi:hypothetical protein